MKIEDINKDNQREKDWRIERLGKWTGSRISPLMSSGRKKDEVFSATGKSLIYEIMSERSLKSEILIDENLWDKYLDLTTSHSKAMQFGTDNEADAINEFDVWLHSSPLPIEISGKPYDPANLKVIRGGSVDHPTIANFSASPDAMVCDTASGNVVAVVETKVPLPKTYMQYVSEIADAETLKAVNADYYHQVHAEMMVTSTSLCFFVAYQPFIHNGLHIVPIVKDNDVAATIEERISLAEDYIKSKTE